MKMTEECVDKDVCKEIIEDVYNKVFEVICISVERIVSEDIKMLCLNVKYCFNYRSQLRFCFKVNVLNKING